jgi:hypothetical protein
VLYAAATGRRPFYGLDDDVKYPQLENRAESVQVRRRLPRRLAAAINFCLEPEHENRPSPAELSALLGELV